VEKIKGRFIQDINASEAQKISWTNKLQNKLFRQNHSKIPFLKILHLNKKIRYSRYKTPFIV